MSNVKLASFFLRIGLAVVFLYAALSSFLDPSAWIGFFPLWVQQNLPVTILLFAFSIYEILLALWILSAWKAKEAAIVAAATLFLITAVNIQGLDIVFRDVAILFAAVGLAILQREKLSGKKNAPQKEKRRRRAS